MRHSNLLGIRKYGINLGAPHVLASEFGKPHGLERRVRFVGAVVEEPSVGVKHDNDECMGVLDGSIAINILPPQRYNCR